MPCMCECGEWFDLNDGYRDRDTNKVVCRECHKINKNAEELEDLLYETGSELDEGRITFNDARVILKNQGLDTSKLKTKSALIEYCHSSRYE